MSVLFFVLAAAGFGFVIFIHELGHFLFAKWAGVKVEVFSIGFGPRLLTRTIGETEYSISLLPLGGYVQMTGQEDMPEDATNPATAATARDPRSFLNASPSWKALILLGGVLFNFLSSYALMLALAFYGLPVLRPVVGDITPKIIGADGKAHQSPAAEMGLRPGDRILTINGEVVRSFEDLVTGAIIAGRHAVVLTVQRPGIAEPLTLPAKGTVSAAYDGRQGRPVLGFEPAFSNRAIDIAARLPPGSAPLEGLVIKPGERVVSIAGLALPAEITGQEILERLNPYFGKSVTLGVIDRQGAAREVTQVWAGESGGAATSLGLPVQISLLTPHGAGAQAGLRNGDTLVAVDGTTIAGVEHFYALVRTAMERDGRCNVELVRAGATAGSTNETIHALLTGREVAGRARIGVGVATQTRGRLQTIAPALDGRPSALAAAGVQVEDTIISFDQERPASAIIQVARGGTAMRVPCSAAGRDLAATGRTAGGIAKLFGDQGEIALSERLAGATVVANSDPDGQPTGSPAPGLLLVKTAEGKDLTVDLRQLAADGTALLATVKPGDYLIGLIPKGDAAEWEILRGAEGPLRRLQLDARRTGSPLSFSIEKEPYRLTGPGEAFAIANRATHNMVWKSLQFIPRFFRSAEDGGLDAKKSLQGPIGIFDELRNQAEHFGIDSFLQLVALIGLNLVLVNLLPIPITDGGQLVFLAIETAIGKPLPPLVRTIAAYIGLALVVSLMLFVTTLDIVRRI